MKLALISLGGKSSKAIADECKNYFSEVECYNLKDFEVQITDDGIDINNLKKKLEKFECIYIRGSFRYALLQRSITRALCHDAYMPFKPKAFTLGHDKFLTLLELQKSGVSIPKTYYAATTKLAKKILEEVDYPVIMKLSEGTHGRGVMIADSLKSAKTILDLLESFNKAYIIQEFVETKNTSDIRVIVAKNKVITAYKRVASDGEIRANIHAGGTRQPHKLTKEEENLAIESARAIGADFCGVDILNAEEKPSVIEINLSPSVYELSDVTGLNVPNEIARELFVQTKKFMKRKKVKMKKKMKKIVE